MPPDSRCTAGSESGRYRWGKFRGIILRAMSGSVAGIVETGCGAWRDWNFRFPKLFGGTTAAVLLAASLAACSTGNAPSETAALSPGDIAYRTPNAARPHFSLTEMASLSQMSDRQLTQRLGAPDFTRRDAPAEIWQYRSASCVLDVFLYPEDGGLKVVHATTRDRVKLGTPDNSCTPFPDQRSASAQ
jgi:hypothetical protein